MILEFIILTLSVALIASIVFSFNLFNKNTKLQDEINSMKDSVQSKVKHLESQIKIQEELVSIEPGDKALLPNYGLKTNSTNHSFEVTYEVEITEVSLNKVKVNAIDYTSHDSYAKDPKNRQSIINFLQNYWISKNQIELIVDTEMRREKKLNQILN